MLFLGLTILLSKYIGSKWELCLYTYKNRLNEVKSAKYDIKNQKSFNLKSKFLCCIFQVQLSQYDVRDIEL